MNQCQNCVHWQRHYPNDGGICWKQDITNLQGLNSRTSEKLGQEAIGDTLGEMFKRSNLLVTRFDAVCDSHTPMPRKD